MVAMAVATGLAACGGKHHEAGPTPMGDAQSYAAPASSLALLLPASTGGPTTCTVYESGQATRVMFDSESLNVTGECQAWTSRQSGAGYLWSYQPTDAAIDVTAIPKCDLRDPSGRVTAVVIEDTGFAPASPAERADVASACTRLTLAGWRRSLSSR